MNVKIINPKRFTIGAMLLVIAALLVVFSVVPLFPIIAEFNKTYFEMFLGASSPHQVIAGYIDVFSHYFQELVNVWSGSWELPLMYLLTFPLSLLSGKLLANAVE